MKWMVVEEGTLPTNNSLSFILAFCTSHTLRSQVAPRYDDDGKRRGAAAAA